MTWQCSLRPSLSTWLFLSLPPCIAMSHEMANLNGSCVLGTLTYLPWLMLEMRHLLCNLCSNQTEEFTVNNVCFTSSSQLHKHMSFCCFYTVDTLFLHICVYLRLNNFSSNFLLYVQIGRFTVHFFRNWIRKNSVGRLKNITENVFFQYFRKS